MEYEPSAFVVAVTPVRLEETVTRRECLGFSRDILGLHFAFSLFSVHG